MAPLPEYRVAGGRVRLIPQLAGARVHPPPFPRLVRSRRAAIARQPLPREGAADARRVPISRTCLLLQRYRVSV
ncbi:hypothetical protein SFRURICE_002185 [Spodoptera frugiperda]|nr:hypothetical protein SFRURICE_002185 [Spodoptera frugiperda]